MRLKGLNVAYYWTLHIVRESYSFLSSTVTTWMRGKKCLTHIAQIINTSIFSLLKNSKWNQLAQFSEAQVVRMVISLIGDVNKSQGKSLKQLVKIYPYEMWDNLPLRPPMPKFPHTSSSLPSKCFIQWPESPRLQSREMWQELTEEKKSQFLPIKYLTKSH